jgi:hypothetical protein
MGTPKKMKTFLKFSFIQFMLFVLLSPGHASEEQFSMQIQGKMLSEVFQELAQLSGSDIVFDKAWANQPISTRFVNLTLEKAINKILTNLNHVVIFEQNNIRIKIFGPVSPDTGMSQAPAAANRFPNRAPANNRIRPSASPFPIAPGQGNDTDESVSEETIEPTESEPEEEEVKAEAEDSAQEDADNTNKKGQIEDQEPAEETEASSAEDDKETGSDNE